MSENTEGASFIYNNANWNQEDEISERWEEVELNEPTRFRKVIQTHSIPDAMPNQHDPTATIHSSLVIQRLTPTQLAAGMSWEDTAPFPANRLRGGEHLKFNLSVGETKRVFQALARRYVEEGTLWRILEEVNVAAGDADRVTIVDGEERETLLRLIQSEGAEALFEMLNELSPELSKAVALRRQHASRTEALALFKEKMELAPRSVGEWAEYDWELFFRENTWIFGFGLNFQFMSTLQNQPEYGAARMDGVGAPRGDVLMNTEAEAKFTVLVEIKLPTAGLMMRNPYRVGTGVYRPAKDLSGGVSQMQLNCSTWERVGAEFRPNAVALDRAGIFTYEPKGILIVGRTREFEDNEDKLASFQRFRRSLHNPEVITFDELYERAVYLCRIEEARQETGEEVDLEDEDEVQF